MTDTVSGRLSSPLLHQLLGYWDQRRGTRAQPSRGDLEPADLARMKILPNVMLLDVDPEPLRFRFRLAGTEVSRRFKREPTGRYLEELEFRDQPGAGLSPDWANAHLLAARSGRPQSGFSLLIGPDDDMLEFEWLILPLSSDGARIDRLLAGAAFERLGIEEPAAGYGRLALG